MKAMLVRTTSAPVHVSASLGSPRLAFSDPDSGAIISFSGKSYGASPRPALHFQVKEKKALSGAFQRTPSEANMASPERSSSRALNKRLSRSFPAAIAEEEGGLEGRRDLKAGSEDSGGAVLLRRKVLESGISDSVSKIWPVDEVVKEEFEASGGGTGEGRKVGGGKGGDGIGDFSGGSADQSKIGAYYQKMLQANPGDPLLLRNYGKYLHEVERDTVKAEECYERAILASPGDGEVLSLYAKLIWETQRDGERAEGYFEQAIKASPDDCNVLGSYAHFLWDAEEDEEAVEQRASSLVAVF